MFFADPVAGFANVARALRPKGSFTFVCWQEMARNDWIGLLFPHSSPREIRVLSAPRPCIPSRPRQRAEGAEYPSNRIQPTRSGPGDPRPPCQEIFRRSADGDFEVSQLSLKCNFSWSTVTDGMEGSPVVVLDSALDHWQAPGALLRTLVALV